MPTRKSRPGGGGNYPLYGKLRKIVADLRRRHGRDALRAEPTFRFPLPPSRRTALRVLGSERPGGKDVMTLLNSGDRLEMLAGLHGLGKLKTALPEGLTTRGIGSLLMDKNEWVREAAMRAVGAHEGLAKHVVPLLKHKDPGVRRAAVGVVGAHKGLAKHVVPLLKDGNPGVRWAAVGAVGAHKGLAKHVVPLLKDGNPGVRGEAVRAVGAHERLAAKHVVPLLEDKTKWVRWAAVWAVGGHEGLAAKHVVPLLKDGNPGVREEAVRAVGAHEGLAAKHVVPLLEDRDSSVRRAAMRAVWAHEGLAERHVVPLLKHKDWRVREEAVRAVRKHMKPEELGRPEHKILGSRRPHLATPYRDEVARRLKRIDEVSEALKKNHPRFTGIVVLGSTAKGYAEPASDLDVAVLGEGAGLLDEARRLLGRDYEVCGPVGGGLTRPGKGGDLLFRGLFFGRREGLENAQKAFLRRATPGQWAEVGERIAGEERNISKAGGRLGVDKRELDRLGLRALLHKVPPPLKVLKRSKGWD